MAGGTLNTPPRGNDLLYLLYMLGVTVQFNGVRVFKTILVAIDHPPAADRIIAAVQSLRLPHDSHIILAHVIAANDRSLDRAADQPQSQGGELIYGQIEAQLQSYQAQLSGSSQIEIVMGDPAEEILRLANIHSSELIVLGSRGLTGVARIVQQSVSSQIVADATCSVFVVKALPTYSDPKSLVSD